MAGMSHEVRERTDALDAAGNTTAAIGKVVARTMCLSKELCFWNTWKMKCVCVCGEVV